MVRFVALAMLLTALSCAERESVRSLTRMIRCSMIGSLAMFQKTP